MSEAAPAPAAPAAAPAAPAAAPGGAPAAAPSADPAADPAPSDSGAIKVTSSSDPSPTPSDWTSGLNPELKDYVTTKGFKDPGSVVDSYRNLEKLRGVPHDRLLKLPEATDSPEWQDVYQKLGKPTTPEEYGLKSTDGGDPAFVDWAKGAFHELNLTKSQAEGLVQKFGEFANNRKVDAESADGEKYKQQEMDLKKEWGAAYHQNIANAQQAARSFDIPGEAIDALEKVMGFDGVMKFMNNLGSKVGEATFKTGDGPTTFGGDGDILTPAQAKAKIASLKKDPTFTDKWRGGDAEAKARLSRLHKMAYPDG